MKRLGMAGLLMLAVCTTATNASAQAIAQGKNEMSTDLFFITTKGTGDVEAERFTQIEWSVAYARFFTDRFAAGPLFRLAKSKGSEADGYVGGQGQFYFGDLTRRAIPFVELNGTKSFKGEFGYSDVQFLAGLMMPMGSTGGRFRVAPYFYKTFYDESDGGGSFQAFGISWSVALLF